MNHVPVPSVSAAAAKPLRGVEEPKPRPCEQLPSLPIELWDKILSLLSSEDVVDNLRTGRIVRWQNKWRAEAEAMRLQAPPTRLEGSNINYM